MRMCFYIAALGIAENSETGEPEEGAVKVDFGVDDIHSKTYEELIEGKDPMVWIEKLVPGFVGRVSNAHFITPEQYVKEYGEE